MKIEKRVKTQKCENCGVLPPDSLCFLVSYGCVYCEECCILDGISAEEIQKFKKDNVEE